MTMTKTSDVEEVRRETMPRLRLEVAVHADLHVEGVTDEVVEVFVLNSALDPHNNYEAFRVEDVCKLMNQFYPNDFMEQEKLHMKIQLEHFQLDAHQSTELQKTSTVVKLCQELAKTNKSSVYPLLDRIIRLVLTLSMSTATTE
ncbi:hypothetical protein PVK06_034385 [Gossypium arboreum]|uniref:Uncharacterized protein n=1 Tax=Gossypium arboreum TaxID=29729 RepID=A0ABR0NE26_GOSAR|nr:hypothetical protein PVK06_034385 [Gossypium arboreum]